MGQAADDLRQDIERTRADMADTLDAIGDKVSPKLQVQRQAERLRRSGIEPRRAALAVGALGIAMFLVRRRRRRHGGG